MRNNLDRSPRLYRRPTDSCRGNADPHLGVISRPALVGLLILLSACASDTKSRDALRGGEQAFAARNYDKAIFEASSSISAGPPSADAYYLRGRAVEDRPKADQAALQRDLASARADYLTALSLNPGPQIAWRVHASLGNLAFSNGDYAPAVAELSSAADGAAPVDVKGRILYLMGISQQRLGRFLDADQTFARVVSDYAQTPWATEARAHQGVRGFTVQVGAFSQPADVDRAAQLLRNAGLVAQRVTDPHSHLVTVRTTPMPSYAQAQALQRQLIGVFPGAVIVP